MEHKSSFPSAASPDVESGLLEDVDPLLIRPPLHRLDRRFILWRTLNTVFWAIGVVGTFVLLYLFFESIRGWMGPVIWVVSAIFAVNVVFMPTYRYLVHRWETSDRAVYTLTGWITREWRLIPISRIQSIETVQGPVERALNLATIKVTTASAQGGVRIEGLNADIATKTVRHLNWVTQETPGDAT